MIEGVLKGGLASASLGQVLQGGAQAIGMVWRRFHFQDKDPLWLASLEGVVEPLAFEIGRSLDDPGASPHDAWTRTRGLLRLAPRRGAKALDEELDLLGTILDEVAKKAGAPAGARRRVREMVCASQDAARAELRALVDPGAPLPQPRFGGLVVEIFEQRGSGFPAATTSPRSGRG